jgi:anti-sigma B factor antagonist
MDSKIREIQGMSVVDLFGQIKGQDSKEFLGLIGRLLDQGKKKIALNFKDVSFVDSGCLGSLMASRKLAVERGAEIMVLSLSDDQRDLFEMTNIISLFPVFDSERDMFAKVKSQQ